MVEQTNMVVVVGGIIALARAWRAVQRGLAVTVVERSPRGARATRVAAGVHAPGVDADVRASPSHAGRIPRGLLARASSTDVGITELA